MTVAQLIKQLEKLNPNSQVIMQKDAEGNGYSPLDSVDGDAIYEPDSTYSGSVFSAGWTADEAGMAEDEWEKFKYQKRCVVLAPIN